MLRAHFIGLLVLWLATSILSETSAAETPFKRRFVTQERSDFAAENASARYIERHRDDLNPIPAGLAFILRTASYEKREKNENRETKSARKPR